MICFFVELIFLILFFAIGIPIMLVEWIIGKFNRRLKDIQCLRIVQFGFKAMLFIGRIKTTVIGEENVPKDQAVLYVANHRDAFDVPLTYSRCPGLTGFVAKKELLQWPFLRDWMKALYCLFLDRSDIKAGMKTILQGIEYIKSGISIFIFPEGTRSKTDEMLPFKEGSLKMAEKTGCLIVPIAITNSANIFNNHFPKIKPTHVILEYGTPIDPKALSKEERKFLGAYTQQRIQEMLDKNAHLV